jgi:hypothetical protein
MPFPPLFTKAGIVKETAYGGGGSPLNFVAVNGEPKPKPNLKYLEDKSWRGWMGEDQDFIPGPYSTSFDWEANCYPDIAGFPIVGTLGDVSYSGTAIAPTGTVGTGGSAVGATSIPSSVSIPTGTLIQIDTGLLSEVVTTTGVPTGAGPFTIPVPALKYAHLAGVAITAVNTAGPFTTLASVLNSGTGQPPSYAITDFYGPAARQYPGILFTEFGLKFEAGALLTYSAKAMGLPETTTTTPTASFSAERAIAGYSGVVTLAGATTNIVESGDLTIKREAEGIEAVDGTQAPRQIWGGMVSVDGKMVITVEDEAQYTNFLTNVQPSFDLNYAFGAGVNARQVKFHLSKAAYTTAVINRGKKWVQLDVGFKGRFNSSDVGPSGGASPILVTLQNAITPGTYK